ncbi:glutamine-rich protein 2-like [Hetaerina americana]|uniref:glutamine-rich protein 2-like n=1 Tax=Hetaerina americana TaxID=62018 RepID=UPI003A7F1D18
MVEDAVQEYGLLTKERPKRKEYLGDLYGNSKARDREYDDSESDNAFEKRGEREGGWYSKTKFVTDNQVNKSDDLDSEHYHMVKTISKMSTIEDDNESIRRKRSSSPEPEILEHIGRLEQKITEITSKLEAAENLTGHVGTGVLLSRKSHDSASTPFSDALKLISISKRVDACEENLGKLAPALEDLAKEASTNSKKFNDFARTLGSLVPGLEGTSEWQMADQKSKENLKTGTEMKRISLSSTQQSGIDNKVIEAFTEMQQNLIAMKEELSDMCSQQKYISSLAETIPVDGIAELQNQISELKTKMDGLVAVSPAGFEEGERQERLKASGSWLSAFEECESFIQKSGSPITEDSINYDSDKIAQLEDMLKEHSSRIDDLRDNLAEQIDQSQVHTVELEKELATILEKVNINSKTEISDMTSLGELYEKVINLEENIDVLNETTAKLAAGNEDKQTDINVLLEQIEQIKIMKADKEALEDALTDKADALAVNRKVSHDQFDAAFEELNRTIDDAQAKLGEQERGWLNALKDIQKEISSKIDRIEIIPLKEMIDNKMQNIQERIKAMTARRQEIEALGAKKKLIRNLNCISCDMKVVMRTTLNAPALPRVASLPPHRSMRPYLTYELDQVRQQNKRLPSRNMLHFENAMVEQRLIESAPKSDQKENHLCSRYCGGSHTIVTSQQRVTRVGHFPEVVIANERGTKGLERNIMDSNENIQSTHPTPRSS